VINTDSLETLCASPEEAVAHMRSLIEDLPVRLARKYPDQEELPARDAGQRRAHRRRAPGRRDARAALSRLDDGHRARFHVLGADSLRWQGFKRALATPDRPGLSDAQIGGPLARRLALAGFDEASRPA
jgi:hypothetical protein